MVKIRLLCSKLALMLRVSSYGDEIQFFIFHIFFSIFHVNAKIFLQISTSLWLICIFCIQSSQLFCIEFNFNENSPKSKALKQSLFQHYERSKLRLEFRTKALLEQNYCLKVLWKAFLLQNRRIHNQLFVAISPTSSISKS